jgi:hypothetical protein
MRGTSQGGAPGRGEGDRREREGRGSLVAPKSTGNACRGCRLRREISLWLVDDFVKEQREMEEEATGYL